MLYHGVQRGEIQDLRRLLSVLLARDDRVTARADADETIRVLFAPDEPTRAAAETLLDRCNVALSL